MLSRLVVPVALFALVSGIALVTGCAEGPVKVDPEKLAELRGKYVLGEEPEGAQTPVGWREDQPEDTQPNETQVVLVGQIGGMPNPYPDTEKAYPWRENEATFFLVDPATAAEFADHLEDKGEDHAADCPFCAREAANQVTSIVAVTFVDESGNTTPIDARELLSVAAGDTVVVRGKLSLRAGDLLVMKADGLYRRD